MVATRSSRSAAVRRRGHFPPALSRLVMAAVVLGLCGIVAAAAPPKKSAKEEIPPPEEIGGRDLLTRDGVQLKATFYPSKSDKDSSKKRKDAVPVILLHMWKGGRKEFASLAPLLQRQGHAVLVPDLRGHGESKTQIVGAGRTRELDASKFGPDDFARMVSYDMETLKAFLMTKNNAGELNIEKLCVVGGEMGASVALDWARLDWSWQDMVGIRQGRDVQALVLISPELNFHGLDVSGALRHPAVRSRLSVLIIVGKGESRAVSQAQRIEGMFSRYRPDPSDPSQQDLFFYKADTKLQGTKMLGVQGLNLETGIVNFIDRRLAKQDIPWNKRGNDRE